MFIGAAANPFAEPFEFRVHRLAKKIRAGADFIQTQCIYNMDKFREFIQQANDMGLTEKVYILAGVTPMKSARHGQVHEEATSPGMDVPDEIIKRIAGRCQGKQADEGIKIALEQIAEFKEMKGVARRPPHGHRVGAPRAGNRRKGRNASTASGLTAVP